MSVNVICPSHGQNSSSLIHFLLWFNWTSWFCPNHCLYLVITYPSKIYIGSCYMATHKPLMAPIPYWIKLEWLSLELFFYLIFWFHFPYVSVPSPFFKKTSFKNFLNNKNFSIVFLWFSYLSPPANS